MLGSFFACARCSAFGFAAVSSIAALGAVAPHSVGYATTEPPPGSDPSADSSPTSDSPLAVEHLYGTTEIDDVPERIVIVGYHGGDITVALGVVPVGIEADFNGADADGFQPWFHAAVDELGGELPDLGIRGEAWEINFERIAGLDPDLILATRGWISAEEYTTLSEIAPTVGPLVAQGNPGPWDDEMRLVADILDKEDEAERVIAEVEGNIDAAREAHPDLIDTTVAWSYSPIDGQIEFLVGDYGGLNTFRLFGITDAPSIPASDDGSSFVPVSLELLSDVEADFSFMLSFDEEFTSLNDPLFAAWEPIAEGRYVLYADYLIDSAISNPTALNLQWLIDDSGFLDLLERALDGDAITIGPGGSVASSGEPITG